MKMEEYTEVEAYKHLLEITENIIQSLNTQKDIINKYEALKYSILSKITPSINSESYQNLFLNIYKEYTQIIFKAITHFEE